MPVDQQNYLFAAPNANERAEGACWTLLDALTRAAGSPEMFKAHTLVAKKASCGFGGAEM